MIPNERYAMAIAAANAVTHSLQLRHVDLACYLNWMDGTPGTTGHLYPHTSVNNIFTADELLTGDNAILKNQLASVYACNLGLKNADGEYE